MSLIKYIVSFACGVVLTLALVNVPKRKDSALDEEILRLAKYHEAKADSLYYEVVYRDARIDSMKTAFVDVTKLPKSEQDSLIKKWLR